jgi:hypothetical protein
MPNIMYRIYRTGKTLYENLVIYIRAPHHRKFFWVFSTILTKYNIKSTVKNSETNFVFSSPANIHTELYSH